MFSFSYSTKLSEGLDIDKSIACHKSFYLTTGLDARHWRGSKIKVFTLGLENVCELRQGSKIKVFTLDWKYHRTR